MSRIEWSLAVVLALGLAVAARSQPAITVLQNFHGIAADGAAPPNTSGKAGATQFVQWVNREFAVYDKTSGKLVQAPRPGNSLWTGFGGPCETRNDGQPMVEWDKLAGRWVLAQLALSDPAYYCFAVSVTPSATGKFFLYAFPFPAGMHPDAPRLAVWPDAYYAAFNIHPAGKRAAPLVVAYDRSTMIAGTPARAPVSFQPAARLNLLPADFDGLQPPAQGEPAFYAQVGGATFLSVFQFHVDFSNPGASSFNLMGNVQIQSAGLGCSRNPPQWKSGVIAQPGAANGVKLDAYPDQLMYRLAWRKVNNTEHLVANQTAILSDAPVVAGVAWYDVLVSSAGGPTLVQQGTVSNPALSFWIGSMAQDKAGDMALGFNASGSNLFPSIAAAGRLVTDPLGTMSAPAFLVKGGGAQLNTSKWGSHADLSVDPVDDCVFWFTAEYVKTSKPKRFDWSTRILSFRFNACQ